MLICIDYDKTYTADIDLWNGFISSLRVRGHKVICCTMRHENVDGEGNEVKKMLGDMCNGIYFTGREAKQPYLSKLGIVPDIWIDDNPAWIYTNG